jgi:putative hydrolase of the HAD superfamily
VIRGVFFDFGETLVERLSDAVLPLRELVVTPFPESVAVLAEIKGSGYRVALVSNTSQSDEGMFDEVLRARGMRGYFDAIVTSVDVGHEKPHPAIFLRALERLGCAAEEVVMVGDDLAKDIQWATDMGMVTIHVRREEGAQAAADPKPTFRVSTLAEIPGILERLQGPAPPPR